MDGSLQVARREGDPLRMARLHLRSGEGARAFDLLAPLWRGAEESLQGHLSGELAAAFGSLERPERLQRAETLEELEVAGCAPAGEALTRWLPPSRLLAGASCLPLRAALYRNALSRLPLLLWGEQGTGHTLAARILHALGGHDESSFVEIYALSSRRRTERDLAQLSLRDPGTPGTLYLSYANELGRWRDWVPETCRRLSLRLVIGMHTGVSQSLVLEGAPLISQGIRPLRERLEDLPALVHALLRRAGVADPAGAASEQVLSDLADHDWPGNVRELANHVARAVRRADGDLSLIEEHLKHDLYGLPGEVGE
ncbi:MAG: hypothetical protein JKY65_13515 [Planctomycetes bacterium]|nr:hypothetical protein [Planctomycetota bacterium]